MSNGNYKDNRPGTGWQGQPGPGNNGWQGQPGPANNGWRGQPGPGNNGWRDQTWRAGRDMDDCVERAIRTGDYSLLSTQINRSLNQAIDAVHDTVFGETYRTGRKSGQNAQGRQPGQGAGSYGSNAGNYGSNAGSYGNGAGSYGSNAGSYGSNAGSNGSGAGRRPGQDAPGLRSGGRAKGVSSRSSGSAYEQAVARSAYGGTSYAIGSGKVKVAPVGFAKFSRAIGWLGFAVNLMSSIVLFLPQTHPAGGLFFLIMALFFYWLKNKGSNKVKQADMAKRIVKLAGNRDVVAVDEIGSAFGLSRKETGKAIRSILQDGTLSGTVYLDKDGTTLMLSDEAYAQYKQTMAAYEQRKREEDAALELDMEYNAASLAGHPLKEYEKMQEQKEASERSKKKRDAKLDAETQKILEEGHAFIRHIHEKNDEIPGEDISEKLDRLERTVTKIFDQVEANPKSAPDLHKLMSYYLPTTQKLIDTYATLDAQHVQGSNIDSAKQEIENSLDVINDAYEKLFDSFFQSTAWDVGTDVTVMKTMLRQDGLTDDEFQEMRKRRRSEEAGADFTEDTGESTRRGKTASGADFTEDTGESTRGGKTASGADFTEDTGESNRGGKKASAGGGSGSVHVGPLEFGGGAAMAAAPEEEEK